MTRQRLDYQAAGAMLAGGMSVAEVARRFEVTRDAIYQARRNGRIPRAGYRRGTVGGVPYHRPAAVALEREASPGVAALAEFVAHLNALNAALEGR